jgi:prepilin-type processing-associated H-X9-DG protein
VGLSDDSIPDGLSQTLMLSENRQSFTTSSGSACSKTHSWASLETTTSWSPSTPFVNSFGYGKASTYAPNAGITNNNTYPTTFIDNIESMHSGGANAAFCDGRVAFLSSSIGPAPTSTTIPTIYGQLVNPNDQAASTPPPPLDESQFPSN